MQPYQTIEQICADLAARPEWWAEVRDGRNYLPLLLFLEHPYSVVEAQFVEGLVAAGLPRSEVEPVSLRELVIFALTPPFDLGWGAHAVSWIDAGFPIDDGVASTLERIAQVKRIPQRVRHRAFSAAKRWRRAGAGPTQAGGRLMSRHPRPTLVLLPGLDGTGSLFCEFRQALDASITTMVISYPCDGGVDYVELEGITRTSLPRRQPFVLLGESFSGPIAISIAASRPAGLRGLILSCSFAQNPLPLLSPLRPLVRFLPIRAAPLAMLARPVLGRFATPRLQSALADALSRVPSWVIRRRLRAVLGVDVTALLPQVQVPALYLRASEDRLVPRAASAALSDLPRIRFAQIDGPHFLLQARPWAAASQVRAFLREIKVL